MSWWPRFVMPRGPRRSLPCSVPSLLFQVLCYRPCGSEPLMSRRPSCVPCSSPSCVTTMHSAHGTTRISTWPGCCRSHSAWGDRAQLPPLLPWVPRDSAPGTPLYTTLGSSLCAWTLCHSTIAPSPPMPVAPCLCLLASCLHLAGSIHAVYPRLPASMLAMLSALFVMGSRTCLGLGRERFQLMEQYEEVAFKRWTCCTTPALPSSAGLAASHLHCLQALDLLHHTCTAFKRWTCCITPALPVRTFLLPCHEPHASVPCPA